MERLLVALVILLTPLAAAQNASTDELPVGAGAPDEQESLESEGAGPVYAVAVVVGTIAFASAFGYAAWRYARRPPGGPPSPPQ